MADIRLGPCFTVYHGHFQKYSPFLSFFIFVKNIMNSKRSFGQHDCGAHGPGQPSKPGARMPRGFWMAVPVFAV